MLYAIFSDVHGNYCALKKFFEETTRADRYLCLGDIVHNGNSFDENLCLNLIRAKEAIAIRGNHDNFVLKNEDAGGEILPYNLEYIANMPQKLTIDGKYFLLHSPSLNRIFTAEDAEREFKEESFLLPPKIKICFFGHSHQRAVYFKNCKRQFEEETIEKDVLLLKPELTYFINPGSLGSHWYQHEKLFEKKIFENSYLLFDDKLGELHFRSIS